MARPLICVTSIACILVMCQILGGSTSTAAMGAGRAEHHECFHDELLALPGYKPAETMDVNYNATDANVDQIGRGFHVAAGSGSGSSSSTPVPAAAGTFQNMRVKIVWDADGDGYCKTKGSVVTTYTGANVRCQAEDVLTNIRKDYVVNTLMAKAKLWIESALNVLPVQGNLIVSGAATCGSRPGITIPTSDKTTGQPNTDFLIYVTAVPMADPKSATLAWASACRKDANGRPVVGHVNWVPSKLTNADSGNVVGEREDVYVGIHEIMHVLGFANPFFGEKGYLKEGGNPQLSSSYTEGGKVVATSTNLGKTVTKLTSPRVVAQARLHFGCNSLDGLEVEDQGGAGTIGSHWEKRIMYQDVMNGVGSNVASFVSRMTLAFFEDTGHYTANYGTSDVGMTWGSGKGCDWINKKCISGGKASGDEFCTTDKSTKLCTHDRLGIGKCDKSSYSSALPSHMQYFSDPTAGAQLTVTDYCSTVVPFSNTKCIDAANVESQDIYGNDYTSSSRCYDSNFIEIQYTSPGSSPSARCFKTSCNNGAITLSIDGKTARCPTDGSAGAANVDDFDFSFSGYINCPKASIICEAAQFAPPTPAPPTPIPTPLPPGHTYAPTRQPPTPPATLASDCASRRKCADDANLFALMPACRELADDVVNCFGTNCDGDMVAWLTGKGFKTDCANELKFKDKCQEGNAGVRDICYLVNGGAASLSSSVFVAVLVAMALVGWITL